MEVHHRVHFDSEEPEGADHFGKDNTVVVQGGAKKHEIVVHLGFLQVNHHYQVSFTIPSKLVIQSLSDSGNDTISPEYIGSQVNGLTQEIPNVHCFLLESSTESPSNEAGKDPSDMAIKIQMNAHKVKLLREKVVLKYPCGLPLMLSINARVLGKGMGTPMLKNGIKCVGSEQDEADYSDWTGFQ